MDALLEEQGPTHDIALRNAELTMVIVHHQHKHCVRKLCLRAILKALASRSLYVDRDACTDHQTFHRALFTLYLEIAKVPRVTTRECVGDSSLRLRRSDQGVLSIITGLPGDKGK